MRVLITGASGRIGRPLMESLLSKGHHVYALTRKPRKLDVFNSRLEISDNYKDPVFSNYNFDVIFLLAANTSAYLHRTKPIEKLIEDVDISLGVISWVLKNSSVKPRIIHLGSMTQYGYETLGAISSKVATSATTFYDLAKQTIENYLRMLSVDGYINQVLGLRLSNVYGIIEESGSDRGFLDQLIGKSLKGCEVSVFGAGNYLRDYLHIDDLIECLLVCLDVKFEERFLPINIGTGTGTTIRNAIELVDKISRKFDGNGLSCKLEEFPSTSLKIETRSNYVDSNEVFSILGWKSKITLTEGVERTFQKIVDSQQKLVK